MDTHHPSNVCALYRPPIYALRSGKARSAKIIAPHGHQLGQPEQKLETIVCTQAGSKW